MRITRRVLLGGLLGSVAKAGLANAPLTSPRPPRFTHAKTTPASAADLIAAASLGGRVSYVVADAKTGLILEARDAGRAMPPASTAKAITSLYALEHLGASHRFETRLIATGLVQGGVLQGDLVLAGGGDPGLTTDDLGDLAKALVRTGLRSVTGRFLVWGGALPYLKAIDQTQPDWLGYNPAVCGLNLNYNRVNFVWKKAGSGYEVGMDARADRFAPKVYSANIKIAERDLPVFTYKDRGRIEEWTVARGALGNGGSRWLPVRHPDLYAGDVFQTLARAAGVALPSPQAAKAAPSGTVLVAHKSPELASILRGMMKHSNNMTAEAVGMAASVTQGVASHVASGRAMAGWLGARAGGTSAKFADHSGLVGASRISAEDMVRALTVLGPRAGLRGLMKEVPVLDAAGKRLKSQQVRVDAKTGTLNFVSSLAGYISAPGQTELVFAIFTGDIARRDAVPDSQKERPNGGRGWVKRSKTLQQQLLHRWVSVYGG
ncbi:MAG: D-alanyl-D-alanine carboxypeptidase/D-alanyl-D-alanine-endopeptidase [Albidovulum sp.]